MACFDVADQRALVTGGSGGIGFAIAQCLAGNGAKVCITGTREEKLQENLAQLVGEGHHYMVANMADRQAVYGLAAQIQEQWGGVDILVNNAGITRDNISLRLKEEDWDQVVEVNLSAVFFLTQKLLRGMIKQKYGRIINISSVVGLSGNAGQANYCATKAGLGGMTRALAQEVAAKNVTVNCIAPGYISSPMTDSLPDTVKQGIIAHVPSQRMGSPEDIAAAALYFASRQASYVTGETLSVNGGLYMA